MYPHIRPPPVASWRRGLFLLALCMLALPARPSPPALALAEVYREGVDLREYWVSEKLDGVRAYWDGRRLVSRGGRVFAAPAWFTEGFPRVPLDGELWMGRGRFERLTGVVRRQRPDEAGWRAVRYRVFDLPAGAGDFERRLSRLRAIFARLRSPYIDLVEQYHVADHATLMRRLQEVVAGGGEGLMLHRASAPYRPGRGRDLLKVKPYLDAEARVVAHIPGKGRLQGMLGALLVEMPDGRHFRIGTGFSDAERRHPPAPGSLVTYRYHGLTGRGLPRFASFLRVRPKE